MRALVLILALAFAPLAGCASIAQLQPQTPREALAEAEIAFVGVLEVTEAAVNNGHLSRDDFAELLPKLEAVSAALDSARDLLRAGDTDGATRNIRIAQSIIRAVSLQLHAIAERETGA